MKTQELISAALSDATTEGVTLYWDSQDSQDDGPAYRVHSEDGEDHDSGPLFMQGWLMGEGAKAPASITDHYHLSDFFRGPDGAYLGPDCEGIYPNLVA